MDWYKVIKYFRNECSSSERTEVEAWFNASDENQEIYLNLKDIWESAAKAPDNINPDFEKAWKKIQAKTRINDRQRRQSIIKLPFKQVLKVAAMLIILVGIGVLIKIMFVETSLISVTNLNTTKKEIRLDDGTIVFLNHNSKFFYPQHFNRNTRETILEGEALFQVAKDSIHPFIVRAGGTLTKVLGTSFNIKMNNLSQIIVSVITGKVAFRPEHEKSKQLLLTKGEQGLYDKNTRKINKSQITDQNIFSWQTGIISFNNQTLDEAAKVLSEYYSKTIEVEPGLQNRLITVSFDNQTLDEVLEILEITLNIKIDSIPERILLKASNNK